MIKIIQISEINLIDKASALLYKVYIEQLNWKFSSDNPSELRIITKNKLQILIDRFTYNNKTVWFGAFDGEELIGCARLCGVDESNKFEVEGYSSSKVIHQYLPRYSCFEMGKVAVLDDYKGKKIVHRLYLKAFEYGNSEKSSVFGCLNNPFIMSLFNRVGVPLKIPQAFKYEEIDSMPVNFYFVDYQKDEFKDVINNLRNLLQIKGTPASSMLKDLERVAQIFPAPMYWHDVNGVVLGINDHCLNGMGTNLANVIGKTPYDFYPKPVAEHILNHNKKVMQTGEVLSQEEPINNITTGELVYAKAIKAPLYDEDGNVIGIIGTSIDITAEKEAKELRKKNHQYELDAEETILTKEFVNEINHTIQYHINKRLKLAMKQELVENEDDPNDISLTKRERLILYCLINGKDSKWIANYISKKENKDLSHTTVVAFINKGLYKKLNVTNIPDLVEKARLMQLLDTMPDDIFN